jgi:hypothetical protein
LRPELLLRLGWFDAPSASDGVVAVRACLLLPPWPIVSILLLIDGYISVARLDPIATTRRGAVVLRPPQLSPALLSLLVLLVGTLFRAGCAAKPRASVAVLAAHSLWSSL